MGFAKHTNLVGSMFCMDVLGRLVVREVTPWELKVACRLLMSRLPCSDWFCEDQKIRLKIKHIIVIKNRFRIRLQRN